MKGSSVTPAYKAPHRSRSNKLILSTVTAFVAVAGIAMASVETEQGAVVEAQSLHARNGGPSIPPDKPSDSKSFLEILKGLMSPAKTA
ncbi:hypothetical protein [Pseudoalteromonas sp. S2755]|uniref:hypothetical protein n=1 Tax=Pseudoalteromonas sp. S2755 TaxID=2066523 RepID=UPI00110B91E2|nr:hypothetical protein [Pseudoalteromonas sp. S2755]TMN34117.1 hypothetical protein CWC03_17145 [Pseudoalteromonas sp. S2755]